MMTPEQQRVQKPQRLQVEGKGPKESNKRHPAHATVKPHSTPCLLHSYSSVIRPMANPLGIYKHLKLSI